MNPRLLCNPLALLERLALASSRYRRRRILRGTPAAALGLGHLDSLELLRLLAGNPPRVIHDVGANAGTWTCLAKSLFPAARVEAFEPLERFECDFARWTAEWPDDVRLHRLALAAAPGQALINVTDFADASSLLQLSAVGRKEFKVSPVSSVSVELARLDDLVASGAILTPDLIKLDVQGYELDVLRGAEVTLRSVHAILCEVSTRAFYEDQPLFGEIASYLESRNFRLHALGGNLIFGQPFAQTDALFVRL